MILKSKHRNIPLFKTDSFIIKVAVRLCFEVLKSQKWFEYGSGNNIKVNVCVYCQCERKFHDTIH